MVKKYAEFTEEQKEKSRAAHRDWARRNPRKGYYSLYEDLLRPDRLEYRMLDSSRRRAAEAGLPFSITMADIVIPSCCPICSTNLVSAKGVRGGNSASPTLDRIIGDKGYVLGNIAVICKGCNSIKGKGSAEEHRRIAEWMDSHTY